MVTPQELKAVSGESDEIYGEKNLFHVRKKMFAFDKV